MAVVVYSGAAFDDFERLFEFLAKDDGNPAVVAVSTIKEAITILEHHPRIGRPVEHGLYELVISHGKSGYIALYRYLDTKDRVLVLTLRHQREAGFDFDLE